MYKLIVFLCLTILSSKKYSQDSIIHMVEKEYNFSSIETKDKFLILLSGKEITNGKILIRILTNLDSVLFEESYPSRYLIGYGLVGELETIENQEKYIFKRMNEFFEEDNFNLPAVGLKDSCDSNYSNCDVWNILKKDQTTVSFYYLMGEGAGCKIAYSKKLKKVLKFYCCC